MEAVAVGVSKDVAASVEASTVFPGFKFSPTDVELISYYLKRKMDGLERSVEVIPETDIYSFEPWDLPDKSIVKSDTEWFFFCSRGKKYAHGSQNRRTTKMGYWKVTGKERDVKSSSQVIGTKRTLVFQIGRAPKGQRTEWLMHEYCMKGGVFMDDALAVCRLRRNREFRTCTSQKAPPEPDLAADKHMILQNGAEWDNHLTETADNLQEETEEDFYGDILRDEIINLDEVVMRGKTPNEVPTLESASMAIRILPLPNTIGRQMASFLEERPSQEKKGKGGSVTESLSSCFFGIYSIKSVNRARWDVIILVVGLIVMLFYLE
ncbi:hypothetical protein Bca52824_036441 [Brassica carinata]|uniref:NAC domain-containing protein n=1 Tax=Brassica carinata TaxID=52824 RepID=A0A8X7V2M7_BRACI|nr:hypothetical protein Bca52824_036441 [Brassica carinata]